MSVNLTVDAQENGKSDPSPDKHRVESLNVSEPPSYNEIVNQEEVEKTQRKIWGSYFIYLSHMSGIHAIRAPYYCNTTECKTLS
jgi:hypothetical protein